MSAAHNVGKERWRQRRLTMHAFKRCESASGKNLTVGRACQRGFQAYHVLETHSCFKSKRMKLLKRSRIPEGY